MIKERKISADTFLLIPFLVEKLSHESDIVAVYLFGSTAQNKIMPLSDIDIAILFKETKGIDRSDRCLELMSLFSSVLKTDECD